MHLPATLLLLFAAACPRDAGPPPAQKPLSCLDAQLAKKGLNPYGDPPDTVYAGGTPLFDEKTGRQTSREAYVARKLPEIAAACGLTAGP